MTVSLAAQQSIERGRHANRWTGKKKVQKRPISRVRPALLEKYRAAVYSFGQPRNTHSTRYAMANQSRAVWRRLAGGRCGLVAASIALFGLARAGEPARSPVIVKIHDENTTVVEGGTSGPIDPVQRVYIEPPPQPLN